MEGDEVKVTALLANHAEAVNNLLYTNGAGVQAAYVPPGTPAPYSAQLAIAVLIAVPWTATNQNHKLSVDLIDAEGKSVEVPTGPDSHEPFRAELNFNVGRPPELQVGEEQNVALAIGMPGLPFPGLGTYRFVLSVDGNMESELSFKVTPQPGAQFTAGPSALPRL